MLSARNFTKFVNILQSQQKELLQLRSAGRSLSSSQWLTQQVKDQPTDSQKSKIYYGTLTPNIKSVKIFSLTTSFAGLVAQPIMYEQATQLGSSTPVIVAVCGFVGFFTFVTPFLLHVITKRYVTELHYDSINKEYLATVISFFLRKQEVKFKVEDVVVPEVPGMFTSFLVKPKGSNKETALFLDPKLFDDPSHYVRIMGYDKPIDFRMDLAEKKPESK